MQNKVDMNKLEAIILLFLMFSFFSCDKEAREKRRLQKTIKQIEELAGGKMNRNNHVLKESIFKDIYNISIPEDYTMKKN